MPTYTDMTRCDGCGECVDICPSDIMHIDPIYRRSYNIEPNFCWECYSCVKACPQNAIDVRGYADFAPLGHKVRVLREPEKGVISWKKPMSSAAALWRKACRRSIATWACNGARTSPKTSCAIRAVT